MWTCTKCGTSHDTEDKQRSCARSERNVKIIAGVVLAAILGVCIGSDLLWNQYAYGDWKCAYMHCVKVSK